MIWAVEWKRLFSALKIFKICFIGVCSGLTCVNIFSQVGLKSGVWKTASFLSSCIRGFFYSPQSYMINVLKINCGLLPTTCAYMSGKYL